MSFAHPEFFWLFLLLPLLAYVQFFREAHTRTDFRYPTLAHVKSLSKSWRVRLRHTPFIMRIIGLSLLIVALARPQIFDSESKRSIEGIDIVMCIDISTSMDAEDLKPDRLEAAKKVAADFVRMREHDRIGIVPFAAESFTQVPLTTDHDVVLSLLGQIQMRMVEDGTAIGMALATSVNRLRESDAKSKVIILLTDGQNNRGEIDPLTAAQAAKALGVRVYTIGVGTRGMAPYPVETVFGKRYQNVQVNIDEEMLTDIANKTGGRYYRATDERSLATIYDQIDQLERTKINVEEYREVAEMFGPWLTTALLCLALEALLELDLVEEAAVIRFELPNLLWLLLLVPIIGAGWTYMILHARKHSRAIIPDILLNRVAYGQSPSRKWLRMGIWLFASLLLIVALARPQIGTKMEEVKRQGVDVLVAVDLSNSMLCEDYSPSRLESAKFAIQKFINGLKGDRIGLIAFAGSAVYHCPLTTDYGAAKLLTRVLNPSIVPEQGTALAEAITMAQSAFSEQEESKSKVLVIITDGEDHEPAALEGAQEAREKGIVIYTIGMGTAQGAPIPVTDAAGRKSGYKKDAQGQVIITRLNEGHLSELAEAGGGSYQRATPGGKELEQIWNDLSKMEKTEFGQMQFTAYEDRYAYFVFPALLLLILEFLIGERAGQFAGFGRGVLRGRS